ncbi:MAG TPA: hypothetical protein RMH99_25105 [Sandaracinaceae bacterium LLY-WYZ-13_1]|nr:hypothetical protein [Sandaracinaceae bacterium LLY-WYZ-13_1]
MDTRHRRTAALARFFRGMQERRAHRARRLRRLFGRLGLADAQEVRELGSRLDLLIGRAARLRADLGGVR